MKTNITFLETLALLFVTVSILLIISQFITYDATVDYFHEVESNTQHLPWFFNGGDIYPRRVNYSDHLFPRNTQGDRIWNQLMYVPEYYSVENSSYKIILSTLPVSFWMFKSKSNIFDKCPVTKCKITEDVELWNQSDIIMFDKNTLADFNRYPRSDDQVYLLAIPDDLKVIMTNVLINWTVSNRPDSTLVTPRFKWMYYDYEVRQKRLPKDYTTSKTKLAFWYVTTCVDMQIAEKYVKELRKKIDIDIFGTCGKYKKPLPNPLEFLLNNRYKFFLAFDGNTKFISSNSYFEMALKHNIVPVVMGQPLGEYERVAPLYSFIHVDRFTTIEDLAEFLLFLDKNDAYYNKYFKWKSTGEFIDTHFWCRLCAMIHAPLQHMSYVDVDKWWSGERDEIILYD